MTAEPFKQSANVSNSGSWNKYSYTENDPVNHTDRTGQFVDPVGCWELGDCDKGPGPDQDNPPGAPRPGAPKNKVRPGNGSNAYLGSYPFGVTGRSLSGSLGDVVLLGPNFFSNSNSVYQSNVLLHELLHVDTGWNDAEIFSNFRKYGLTNPNGDTEDISAWLSTDCRSTPSSLTWWIK